MKKIILGITVLFATANLFAQNREIKFVDCTLDEALKMSQETNKPLFVDCYTSWCGPCKMMAKDVFTNDTVADFFNDNFICIKFDCEKGEGITVAKTYGVSGYPTFLLIDNNKQLIHKMVGGTSAETFISNTKKGLDPETSMYGKRKKYESGVYDRSFLMNYFKELQGINDVKGAAEVGHKILSDTKESDLLTKEIWSVVRYYYISTYGSKWWDFILENSDKYIDLVGKKEFNSKISETMHPYLFGYIVREIGKRNTKADFDTYKELIVKNDLENKDLLLSFWRMGYSRVFDDFNGYFNTVEKEYKTLTVNEHFRIMVNIIDHLAKNVSNKQKKHLISTLKKSEAIQSDYFKPRYAEFYEKLK